MQIQEFLENFILFPKGAMNRILRNEKVPLSNTFLLSPNGIWLSLEVAVVSCERGLCTRDTLEKAPRPLSFRLSSAKTLFSQATREIAGEGSSQEPENSVLLSCNPPHPHFLKLIL